MLVLGLETAGDHGCVGLVRDDQALSEVVFHAAMKHGERLLPAVDAALRLADAHKDELNLLVASVGPGSFTGLRIGLSIAKGLARALRIPLVGVPAFEAYAQRVSCWPGPVWVLLQDRRDWVYAAGYERGRAVHPPRALPLRDFFKELEASRTRAGAPGQAQALFIGPGVEPSRAALERYGTVAPAALNRPSGVQIAQLGLARYGQEGHDELYTLEPLYLQPPLVSEPSTPAPAPARPPRPKPKDEAKVKL